MAESLAVNDRGREPRLCSVVIPVYDEAEVLPILFDRLAGILGRLGTDVEVVLVNDGSRDRSLQLMIEQIRRDPRYKAIALSRNFGHQVAISAGLDYCRGDVAVIMDADLQDPPDLIFEMLERWRQGFDVVYGVRKRREGEPVYKSLTAHVFYRLLNRLAAVEVPIDVGEFRLIDRRALDAFRSMPERDRFVRGMFAWMGFRQCGVEFARPARAAGMTKYPLWKMLNLALSGIISFSDAPLRLIVKLGFLVSALAIVGGAATLVLWAAGFPVVPGWTSLMLALAFFMGVNFILIGIVGLYVGKIHEEVKGRPLYFVEGLYHFESINGGEASGISADESLQPVRQPRIVKRT